MFRLEHPDHGAMHVKSEADIKYNAQFGWKLAKEPEPKAPNFSGGKSGKSGERGENPKEDEVVKLKEQYFNTFGKRPHHMMNTKTIRKALQEA